MGESFLKNIWYSKVPLFYENDCNFVCVWSKEEVITLFPFVLGLHQNKFGTKVWEVNAEKFMKNDTVKTKKRSIFFFKTTVKGQKKTPKVN